jgi:hypothetical protein
MMTMPRLVMLLMLPLECMISIAGYVAVQGSIGFCSYQKLHVPWLLQVTHASNWIFFILPLVGLGCVVWTWPATRMNDVQMLSLSFIRLILSLLMLLLVLGISGLPFLMVVLWLGDLVPGNYCAGP